jgi:hypothetical protein
VEEQSSRLISIVPKQAILSCMIVMSRACTDNEISVIDISVEKAELHYI